MTPESTQFDEILKWDLLACLSHLAKRQGRPHSLRSLTTGLPLEEGRVTPLLFIRALKRLHLNGKIFKKSLNEITNDYTPCVLIMTDGRACYVEKVSEDGFWVATEEEVLGVLVPREEITKSYAGFCIFFKPSMQELNNKKEGPLSQHWLWGTLYKLRPFYYQVMVASLLTNVFGLLVPLYSMNVYDRVVPNNTFSTLWVLSIGILVVLFFDFILKVIKGHFVDTASKNADIVLSSALLEKILGMQISDRTLSAGALASHVKELEVIREFFSSVTLLSLIDIPFACLFLALITYIGGQWFLIACIVFILITLLSSWMMQQMVYQHSEQSFKTSNRKSGFLIETILGLETIKSFGAEGKTQKYWENLSDHHATHYKHSNFFSSLAINLTQMVTNLNYVIFVIIGVYLISTQSLTMGGLIACSILGTRAIAPFSQGISHLMRLNQVLLAYKTIDQIMNMEMERTSDRNYFPKHEFEGYVTFKNVSFTYPGQTIEALHNVSFHIQPKDKLAVLGKIGSGKTTIEKLILGFYSPASGSILMDNIDSRQIDPADLRSQIGYVSQDIYLFAGTVLENILLGEGNFTNKEIENAIVQSGAINFIQHHPQGINMQVGEGGRFLSGGQKQTLGIARAILHNPPFLIFDEPTTMMDQQSEHWFLSHFIKLIEDKTFIVISHNPKLLSLANKVLLLDDGQVKYFGTKDGFLEQIKLNSPPGTPTSSTPVPPESSSTPPPRTFLSPKTMNPPSGNGVTP
ncbi:MAG: type I secretion system permease/ATPase [Alphaproteobacteria bacterium]|jgi:ATP-binding cassette subfamily C protein LapB|nr:type I secretion system permease/ATPase [Alphaproteobacteria bacterium]